MFCDQLLYSNLCRIVLNWVIQFEKNRHILLVVISYIHVMKCVVFSFRTSRMISIIYSIRKCFGFFFAFFFVHMLLMGLLSSSMLLTICESLENFKSALNMFFSRNISSIKIQYSFEETHNKCISFDVEFRLRFDSFEKSLFYINFDTVWKAF